VELSLLGPLQVDGTDGLSPRDRVVLAALAVHLGDALPAERLADALWGEAPPASWPKVVQGSIVRIRRSLGRDAVQTTTGGYRLALGDDEIDTRRFERLVERGRLLAARAEHDRAAATYEQALALWRGAPLADVEDWPDGQAEVVRLGELRRSAEEALLDERLAAGQDIVAEASALVRSAPLREHRWWLLALGLYRAGRQSEALEAVRQARRTLQEDLGLDPGTELTELEQDILQQAPALSRPASAEVTDLGYCPWKGLLVYDRDDSDRFFGREAEVRACLRALRGSPLLVVAGPSGCGKSSMVRAGLVPALTASGGTATVMTPGTDPSSALVAAVASSRTSQVLVVDQLEELFTAGHQPALVVSFLEQLVALSSSGTRVVLVVRADQLGGLSASPDMARLAERGLHLVSPMSTDALREAVEGPAALAGLRLEPGLVELLVREIEDEPGALPLLSHALAETWVRREAGVLTLDGYRATGGIRGAVAQSAEQLWESLPVEQQDDVRRLWLRLVVPTAGGAPTAVRLPLTVAAPDLPRRRVVDLLVLCRLVTTDERTVSVAHEAVITAWPRLRAWLDEDSAGLLTLRHLAVAADDWDARGRPESELYRGARLESALAWRVSSAPSLTAVEEAFLDAGAARAAQDRAAADAAERHRVRTDRRLRLTLAGTALGLVLALVAGTIALERGRDASRTARNALVDKLAAQSVALRATQRDLAALLAVEAYRLRPDASTRSALLGVFTARPGFLGYLPVGSRGTAGVPLGSGHLLADGSLLGVGTDGVLRVIDLATGAARATYPEPGIAPTGALLGVSRDGSTAATVTWEGAEPGGGRSTLSVFDVTARTRRAPEVSLPLDAGAVAVSPDGRFVAVSGYDDGRVLVYDTAGNTRLPDLDTVDSSLPGVVALPPIGPAAGLEAVEDYAAGVTAQPFYLRGDPRLADPRLPPPTYANTAERRYTAGLAFLPDGRLVAGSETGVVRVVDPHDGQVLQRLTGAPWLTSNRTVAMSDDGSVLVTTGSRGVVRWDLRRGRPAWVSAIDGPNCTAALVEPRSRAVLCGGRYSRVLALDLATGLSTASGYDLQRGAISDLLLTSDGRMLVELSGTESVLARWRLDGVGPITRSLPSDQTPIAFNSDGSLLLTRSRQQDEVNGYFVADTAVISTRSGEVLWRGSGYVAAAWADTPDHLVVWDNDDSGQVLDVTTGEQVRPLEGNLRGFDVGGQAVPAGSRYLIGTVASDGGGQTYWAVWDLSTGELVSIEGLTWEEQASLRADGRLLVAVEEKGLATYDVTDPSGPTQPLATRRGADRAAVSSTGLVAAHAGGRIAFYRARTLTAVGAPLREAVGETEQLTFSRDGRLLLVRGSTGAIRLVDTASRTQLGEPIEQGLDRARVAALRPDGGALALRTDDGMRVWDLRPQRWAQAACSMVGRSLTREEWTTFLGETRPYEPGCR
jgi:DNA-binding SARP family transcriptional activator/WD40 repeat protein